MASSRPRRNFANFSLGPESLRASIPTRMSALSHFDRNSITLSICFSSAISCPSCILRSSSRSAVISIDTHHLVVIKLILTYPPPGVSIVISQFFRSRGPRDRNGVDLTVSGEAPRPPEPPPVQTSSRLGSRPCCAVHESEDGTLLPCWYPSDQVPC